LRSAELTHASGTPPCQKSKDSNNKIAKHLVYYIQWHRISYIYSVKTCYFCF